MSFGRYLLYRATHITKWEPQVSDVLDVVNSVHSIKEVVTPRGRHYFYVFPVYYDFAHVADLLRTFRSNGVFLRPHKSRNYGELVWRVPDRGQQFMSDVMRVMSDGDEFQKMLIQRSKNSNGH